MARTPLKPAAFNGAAMLTGIRNAYVLDGAKLDTRPTLTPVAGGGVRDRAGVVHLKPAPDKGGKT